MAATRVRSRRSGGHDAPDPPAPPGESPRPHRTWTPLGRALAATGDRWTLMIVLQLEPGAMRLSRLHTHLPGISTGVLERYIQQMAALGLLTRRRFKEMPPRVELELTSAGRDLLPIAAALARWGMTHAWSPPRAGERIGVELLLRLLPALLDEPLDLPDGCVEAVVERTEPPAACVPLILRDGRVIVSDDPVPRATARIAGDEAAWIAALGPEGDYGQLSFSGRTRLAKRMLGSLPGRSC